MCFNNGVKSEDICFIYLSRGALLATFCGLAQAGIFTTKLPTKPKTQIYEKLSTEALNPRLRQTAVTTSAFIVHRSFWLLVDTCPVFLFRSQSLRNYIFSGFQ